MTDQHNPLRGLLRQIRRDLRDDRIRRGELKPQTHREMHIWLAGTRERFGLDDPEPAARPAEAPQPPTGCPDPTKIPPGAA